MWLPVKWLWGFGGADETLSNKPKVVVAQCGRCHRELLKLCAVVGFSVSTFSSQSLAG